MVRYRHPEHDIACECPQCAGLPPVWGTKEAVKQPRTLTCGHCGKKWEEEDWRFNDGPCMDREFYCVSCLVSGPCGCWGWRGPQGVGRVHRLAELGLRRIEL